MASDLTIQGEVVVSSEKAEAAFDRVGDKADKMAAEVASAASKAGGAVDNIGAGAEKGAERFTRAEARMREAIKKSTQELQQLGKTASEKLEFKIADSGLDQAKFAPYIAELKKVEAAHGKVGVSAAQTAAALRQVPAQFTDIVVSLQSGQQPLTVLLQQGGQLKDMFGGAGAAARAMGGYVMGLVSPTTLAAVAVGALAVAHQKGAAEAREHAKALILSGNAAGMTVNMMANSARAVAQLTGSTKGAAAAAVDAVVGSGQVAAEQISMVTDAALRLEKAGVQSISKTVEQMSELGRSPTQATAKLNEQLAYLTGNTYKQIKALEDQGKADDAAALAQSAYAEAMSYRASQITNNLGTLEKAWKGIAGTAKSAWDAMLDIGREKTVEEKLDELQKRIAQRENQIARGTDFSSNGGGAAFGRPSRSAVERMRAENTADGAAAAALFGSKFMQEENARLQGAVAEGQKLRQKWIDDSDKFLTKQEQRRRELEKATNEVKKLVATGQFDEEEAKAELKKRTRGINEKYNDSTGQSEVAGIKAKTLAAREYYELLLKYGAQADQLTEGEKAVIRIQQELKTSLTAVARQQKEKALAAAQEEAAAERQVENEKKRIKGLEESKNAYAALIDATHKDALALENHANELSASNAVWGKGKVAIEEYRLALVNAKLAEVENGSDSSYDPAYVAALREKAAAQEHVVNAARIADYKELAQKQAEWARQVAEEAVLYQDELALLGLTAREREKIVAVRKVELDLAKKKAEIERSGSTDDKKRELIAAAEATAEQAKATAIAKANLNELLDIVNSVDRTAQQVWTNVFEGGSNAFKKLGQTLKAAVLDLLYQLVIKKWVVSITANVMGSITGGLPGLVSGGNGLLGLAGNAGSLYSLGSSAMSLLGIGGSAGSLYALGTGATGLGLTAGAGGLGLTAGGGLGLTAGSGLGLSGAGVGAGAAGGFGSMLSAIPGWGWALGGLALLAGSGLFKDNSGTPHWGAGATYSNGTLRGGKDIYDNAHFSMGIQDEYSGKVQPFVDSVVKGVGSTLDTISRAFGGKGGYQVSTAYADDSSKDPSFGSFRISKDGKSIVDWNDTRADKWAPRNFADGEEGQRLYLAEIAKDTRKVLLDMDLPSWAKTMLDSIGETANMDDLSKVVQQIGEIQTLFVNLGATLVGFADLTDKAFEALLNASGGAQALAANTDAFYKGFYSDDERKAIAKRQLDEKLKGLGVDINLDDPDARKKYRKLVEDELAKANGEEAAKAVLKGSLADSIIGKGGLDALSGKDLETLVRGTLGPDVASVDIDKLKEGLASLDSAGMSADKFKESVGKLLEPIVGTGKGAAETAAALLGLSGAIADVTTSAEDAAAAEKKRKDEEEAARKVLINSTYDLFKRALSRDRDALSQEASGLTSSINAITSAVSGLRSNAKDLYGSVDSTAQMLAAQGMVYIEDALMGVRGGRKLTDYTGLSDASSAARGGISNGAYVSEFERQRDALVLAGQLTELGDLGDQQLSIQDRQLKALQQQIEYLDNLGKRADDLVNGTVALTETVDSYFAKLLELLTPKDAAGAGKPASGSSGGPTFGPGGGGSSGSSKYQQPVGGYTGGTIYAGVSPEQEARLDKYAAGYHKFDGTGDAAGLNQWIKENKLTPEDLSGLSGLYEKDWEKWYEANGIPRFATGAAFTGGIATRPTAFNMGLMGEAGSEGILPLANVGGRLGVYAVGGQGAGNAELIEEVRALREEVAALRAPAQATANNTRGMSQMAEQFDSVSNSGAMLRTKVTA